MKNLIFYLIFLNIISFKPTAAQIEYYVAAGKDSITYLATNSGLLVLTRGPDQELTYNSTVDDSGIVYTRALDNDNYLIFGTDQGVDLYSLSNKYLPEYIGSLDIPDIVSIRPFGNHFAILRGRIFPNHYFDHYIVGVEQDTFKILSSIAALQYNYTERTEFYPEVVYPYFFSKDSSSNLTMYKYDELNSDFDFIDTLDLVTPGSEFVQIYGGKDRLYLRERHGTSGNYTVKAKKYDVNDDTLYFISEQTYNINPGFTDEIECTDTLIRLNGSYRYLNGQPLNEPNGYLFSYANLSGIRIYNTVQWGVPSYSKMYYSTEITGSTINSAQYIYEPSYIGKNSKIMDFILYENYPNPFNPGTTINFSLPERSDISINVYNAIGELVRKVVNTTFDAGYQSVYFNAEGLPSGVYIYRIEATGNSKTFLSSRKMILVK